MLSGSSLPPVPDLRDSSKLQAVAQLTFTSRVPALHRESATFGNTATPHSLVHAFLFYEL